MLTQCALSQVILFCLKWVYIWSVCWHLCSDYPLTQCVKCWQYQYMMNRRYRGPITALISAAAIALCGFRINGDWLFQGHKSSNCGLIIRFTNHACINPDLSPPPFLFLSLSFSPSLPHHLPIESEPVIFLI